MKRAAVVLCGGKSRRMGYPKWKLPFGDQTMLQRVVQTLELVVHQVVVVAATEQELSGIPQRTTIVRDERPDQGPLEGIHRGLRALPPDVDAAFLVSCDVPLLRPNFVAHLFSNLAGNEAVVPVDEQFHHPLTAVYKKHVAAIADQLLTHGHRRPVTLFDRIRTKRISTHDLRDIDPDLDSLRNLNDPASYFAALRDAGLDPNDLPEQVVQQLRENGG